MLKCWLFNKYFFRNTRNQRLLATGNFYVAFLTFVDVFGWTKFFNPSNSLRTSTNWFTPSFGVASSLLLCYDEAMKLLFLLIDYFFCFFHTLNLDFSLSLNAATERFEIRHGCIDFSLGVSEKLSNGSESAKIFIQNLLLPWIGVKLSWLRS